MWTVKVGWVLGSVDSGPSNVTHWPAMPYLPSHLTHGWLGQTSSIRNPITGTYQLRGSMPLRATASLPVICTWEPHTGPRTIPILGHVSVPLTTDR